MKFPETAPTHEIFSEKAETFLRLHHYDKNLLKPREND